jgi:eukaryotic-like serine/threonine-protein kinase
MNLCDTKHQREFRFCPYRGVQEKPETVDRSSIPSILMEPVARRLRFAAAAAAVLWGAYLALAAVTGHTSTLATVTGAIAIFVSIGLVGISLHSTAPAVKIGKLGSAYFFFTAVALACTEFSTPTAFAPHGGVSWSAAWIAFFPLLVPSSPRRALVKALLAASASPLAFVLTAPADAGATMHSVGDYLMLFAPVYFAAVMAHVVSRVLSGLGAQVVDVREMGMYELETRIAQGGMGEVWRAKHRLLSRPAAVKLIRPHAGAPGSQPQLDAVAEQRFKREAEATASLKSPHTVDLYDFGVTDSGTIYYVMELLEGSDLEELVHRDGPLEPDRVMHILMQTLDSLAEAHQKGLVHRDIKPSNLHVSRRGLEGDFVKVLDFGLVKAEQPEPGDTKLTAANGIVGTPAYLAPELITGDRPVDGRADLYSLGCVAYFLLTGKTVFEAETPVGMAIAHATSTPVPPSVRSGRPIPAELERLVMKCLEKRPEDRPASSSELLAMLAQLDLHSSPNTLTRDMLPSSPSSALN